MFFGDALLGNNSIKDIKIKFEVDINPPAGATFEIKYKLLPSPHEVLMYDNSSLFAGKIHAVLCRNWHLRTKGRDLYDYVFYLSRKTPVNLELVKQKLISSGFLNENDKFDINILKEMLFKKFSEIDYKNAKEDVIPFISDVHSIDLWSEKFFCEITKELK